MENTKKCLQDGCETRMNNDLGVPNYCPCHNECNKADRDREKVDSVNFNTGKITKANEK